jgi:hypothetical protein
MKRRTCWCSRSPAASFATCSNSTWATGKRESDGKQCFVHYAIGPYDVIATAFNRLKKDGAFALLGIYHVELQPYLFEKTFAVWALFQMLQLNGRGENDQLVTWESKETLIVQGISDLVQVNLNRFTSLPGFFNAAHQAGKHTFTVDPDYIWYGMLLKKV